MNVEQKSAHVAHTGATNGRTGKPKTPDTGGAGDAGGFMSVLMSLGAADVAEDALALVSADEMLADDGKMTSALELAQLQQQGLVPGQGAQQEADVAQILQQQGLIPGQGAQQGSDVAQILPSRTGGATTPVAGQMGVLSAAQAAAQNGLAKPVPDGLEGGALQLRKTAAAGNKAAAALSAQLGQELPVGRQELGEVPGTHGALGKEVVSAAATGALSAQMAASALGGESIRQAVRQADKNNGALVGAAAEGGWGAPAFQVGAQTALQIPSASVSAASPEAAIAEQVYYWMSNDVQNAELKLDNWGQSPVEVSISLQGNEARVEFRTDVQEIRKILEEASAQLKDMLQGEGLVLTGVSVGSSGTNGAGAGEQSPRPDARRATVSLPEAAALERPRRAGGASGRSVDVFV